MANADSHAPCHKAVDAGSRVWSPRNVGSKTCVVVVFPKRLDLHSWIRMARVSLSVYATCGLRERERERERVQNINWLQNTDYCVSLMVNQDMWFDQLSYNSCQFSAWKYCNEVLIVLSVVNNWSACKHWDIHKLITDCSDLVSVCCWLLCQSRTVRQLFTCDLITYVLNQCKRGLICS